MHVSSSEVLGDTISGPLRPLLQQFHNAVDEYPENIALICTHQDADLYGIPSPNQPFDTNIENHSYLRWTFKSFSTGVERLKAGLESLGVQRGMAIVTMLPNCAEFALTWWAAMELGAVMAPLDPRRLSNVVECSHMLKTIIDATNNTPPVIMAWRCEYLQSAAIKPLNTHANIGVSSSQGFQNYVLFRDLMEPQSPRSGCTQSNQTVELKPRSGTIDASVLFTSGSTALPKGVWRSHSLQALLAYRVFKGNGYETLPGDLWCSVAHNSHSVGITSMIAPMLLGAGVVYPGGTFSPDSTTEMLVRERCTHMLLVPAMIISIAESIGERNQVRSSLKAVMVAASPSTLQHMQNCFDILGARGVCFRYGSTEGTGCVSDVVSDAGGLLHREHQLTVGQPIPGTKVKICQPDSSGTVRQALPCGTVGEIHFSGPLGYPNIYIGVEDTDDICYVDGDGQRWFVTGDEGVMDQNGNLFIVGRIKDIIIRGGENISPQAIEACLANNAALASISIQIVGQPDPISGESPIAIVNGSLDVGTIARQIHRTILNSMGPVWNPQEVIHLNQLGLDDWPKTSLGKTHKAALRELVRERYFSRQNHKMNTAHRSENGWDVNRLRDEVLGIWAGAVGVEEDDLPLNSTISEFADSLTVARVRGELRRGIPGLEKLSAQDVSDGDTLSAQVEMIIRRISGTESPRSKTRNDDDQTSINAADMVHTIAQPSRFEATKQLVVEAINKHGFTWDDVEDIFPAQNFVDELSRHGVLNSAKFQNSYITNTVTEPERVKRAFEAMLRENRILPSFLVWSPSCASMFDPGVALHVTVKPSEALYEHVLQDGGTVDTAEELQELVSAHPHPEWALFPGVLFRVLIFKVKSTGTVGFIISVSHGVMDATYIERFQSDLDQTLAGPTPRSFRPHTSYKVWAESYYSFRESPQAVASVRWHASYLNGLHDHLLKAHWPPTPPRDAFDPSGSDYGRGAHHRFCVPGLVTLRRQYPEISVPVVIKTALALFNVRQTGHDHAVFSGVQAGRTAWPFMPASFSSSSEAGNFDEATDVAGPLLQSVTNLVRVSSDELVIEMLLRLQTDQHQLTQHAHAPWPDVEKLLNDASDKASGLARDHRGLMRKVFTSQIFNWIPGMGARVAGLREPFVNFKKTASVTRWQVGLIIRAGVGGVKNDEIFLHLLGDALGDEKMQNITKELETLVRLLTHPQNWHEPVGRCIN